MAVRSFCCLQTFQLMMLLVDSVTSWLSTSTSSDTLGPQGIFSLEANAFSILSYPGAQRQQSRDVESTGDFSKTESSLSIKASY